MDAMLILAVIIAFAALALLAWLWGRTLPAFTTSSRAIEIEAASEMVIAAAADVPRVCRCIHESAQVSHRRDAEWRVRFLWVTLEILVESPAPEIVVWHTRDTRGFVQADWRFTVSATPGGCRLSLTETRTTPGPFTRVWQRVWRYDPRHYLDKGLKGVAAAVESSRTAPVRG